MIADAQLAATKAESASGAEIAFTNPGGVRTDLPYKAGGVVTFADLFAVQPFGNSLVTMELTGRQIERILEQQWLDQPKPRILHVSAGFTYRWDGTKPPGERVDPASLRLHGRPIEPDAAYRVTVNSFLADGGDGFSVLKEGIDRVTGPYDVDALADLLHRDRHGAARSARPDRAGRLGAVSGRGRRVTPAEQQLQSLRACARSCGVQRLRLVGADRGEQAGTALQRVRRCARAVGERGLAGRWR